MDIGQQTRRWKTVRGFVRGMLSFSRSRGAVRPDRAAGSCVASPVPTLNADELIDPPASVDFAGELAGVINGLTSELAGKALLRAGTSLGHYEIMDYIGGGGMGRVYRAKDLNVRHVVAVKVLLPELGGWSGHRKGLLQEAQAMISLNHPNICRFYEFDFDHDVDYIVMEYIEGETLRSRLARPITIQEFKKIAEQCLSALVEAHRKNVKHGDIKPENIMLSVEGNLKLCDFGLATWVRGSDGETTANDGFSIGGTPDYMAPEAWLGGEPDIRSDIYSLGVVFYEMLSRQRPTHHSPRGSSHGQKLPERPIPLRKWNPQVPVQLERVVERMLEVNLDARYPSAADVLDDIRAVVTRSRTRVLTSVAAIPLTVWVMASSADHWNRLTNMAVLPCAVVEGSDAEASNNDGHFCDGLMEMVTRQMIPSATASRIEIADPADVRAHKVSTAEEAQDRLGAEIVLAPEVHRLKDGVRITVMRRGVSNGRFAGRRDFSVDFNNVAGLRQEVLASITSMLGVTMRMDSQEVPIPSEASRLLMEGVSLLHEYDKVTNIDKAVSSFVAATALAPNLAEGYAHLSQAYVRKYEFTRHPEWIDVAKKACEQSLSLNQKLAAGHHCMAMLYNIQGEHDKASDEFFAATHFDSTNELAHRELAKAKERIGDLWLAESALKNAIAARAEYWAPYAALGRFYAARANYSKAVEAYLGAIQRSPSNVQASFALSEAYTKLGQYDDAIDILRKSISYAATPQAYSNLGNTLLRLRRFEEAATELEHARRLNPRAFTQIGNLARAYYSLVDRRQQSLPLYAEAIERAREQLDTVNPNDPRVHVMLSWYNAMLGKPSEAYHHLHLALQDNTDPEFFWIAAIVYNQVGNHELALSMLEKARAGNHSTFEIENTAEFDNLRNDPRFRKVVSRN